MGCFVPFVYFYGKASILKKNLNEPVCCTPNRNCRLMLAPAASGVPRFIVKLLLSPPPSACAGGVSNVVPETVMVHGVD